MENSLPKDSTTDRKKQIQKARMIHYFLDAAVQIIEEEGIEAVTIRKVADIAGYNSATLYNYFDDLQHLLFFASMTYLQEYIDDLPHYIKYVKNSEELYLEVWNCFIEYSFLRHKIYYTLFFADIKHDMDTYVSQYYALYPLDVKKFPKEVRVMLQNSSIRNRSKILIDYCIEEGYVKPQAANAILDVSTGVYENMLLQVERNRLSPGVAKELCRDYIKKIYHRFKDMTK